LTIGTTTDGLVDTSSYRALTILNNGNVGIGTTSPATTLSVNGSGYLTGGLGVGLVNTSAGTLQTSGNATIGGTLTVSGTTGTTTIATGQGFTVGSSQFVVQQGSGNVGIGVASPEAKLDIGGIAPYTTYGIIDLGIHRDNAVIYVEGGGYGETNTASLDLIGGRGDNDYINFIRIKGTRTNSVISGARLDFLPVAKTAAGPVEQTAALSIIHNGNVGIGTTSPRVALHVATDGSGGLPASGSDMLVESSGITILNILSSTSNAASVYFGDSGNAEIGKIMYQNNGDYMRFDTNGSERMRITSDGYVGIGTTSPYSTLDVSSTTGGSFTLSRNDTTVSAGDTIGQINFLTRDNQTLTNPLAAQIKVLAKSTIGTDINPGILTFSTTPSDVAGALAERMRIDENGNVGIGTTSPESKLAVAGNMSIGSSYLTAAPTNGLIVQGNVGIGTTTPYSKLSVWGSGTTTGRIFELTNTASTTLLSMLENGNLNIPVSTATTTIGGGLSVASSLYVLQNGNVGIGTTGPRKLLEIASNSIAGVGDMDTGPVLRLNNTLQSSVWGDGGQEQLSAIEFYVDDDSTYGDQVQSAIKIISDRDATAPLSNMTFWTSSAASISERMRITTDGNVGIGTTTPAGLLNLASTLPYLYLTDTNASANNKHWFMENNAGVLSFGTTTDRLVVSDTRAVSILNNGNVGIWTMSPGNKLALSHSNTEASLSGLTIENLRLGGSGSSIRFLSTQNFDSNLTLEAARIQVQGESNWASDAATDSYMHFDLMRDATLNEVVRIKSNGNVGIGTTSPSGKLSITGAGTTTGRAFVIADSNNAERFTIWDSGNVGIGVAPSSSYALNLINSMNLSSSRNIDWGAGNARIGESSYNLSFSTYNGASLAEVMRITGSGNVGIGTSTPEDQFEIAKTGENTVGPMLTFRNTSVGINATTDYILGEIKFAGC